jgi:uncharacterized membrane protein
MTAAYLHEWGSLLLRWLHIVAAMAWIGASFFFMHLDATLRTRPGMPPGQMSAWQVHGGGFYEMRKYMVSPDGLPAELTWHKWQAYWTWISGFLLLVWVYYLQSELFLIDPAVMNLSPVAAGSIGLGALALGWIIYDQLCKSRLKDNDVLLGIIGFAYVVGASWAFANVFSGRGAMIHTGALMATIMSANVFFVIMPGTRKQTDALLAGRAPDPAWGKAAKQRSAHNNYITLPVVFMMISNHYPVTYANPAIIPLETALVIIGGALIRHFYNVRHADHARSPWWAIAAAALVIWTALWIAMSASPGARAKLGLGALPDEPSLLRAGLKTPPDHVVTIVTGRCAMCHAPEPSWERIEVAPKNVMLDTPERIARLAEGIRVQSVMTHAMPPNNVSGMTERERAQLAAWLGNR